MLGIERARPRALTTPGCYDNVESMDQADIERLETAVEALNERELDPFVALMTDDMVWTAQPHRWLWWRQTPG